MTRQGGSGTEVDGDALAARVGKLVERGLERYGVGDLAGALGEWERALSLSPEDATAKQYVDYVKSNFDALDTQFQQAQGVVPTAPVEGAPAGDSAFDDEEFYEDEYESFELTDPGGFADEESVDQGWVLNELPSVAPLPPTPDEIRERLGPGLEVLAEAYTGVPSGGIGDGSTERAAAGESLPDPKPGYGFPSDRAQTTRFEPSQDETDFSDLNATFDSGAAPAVAADDSAAAATDRGEAIDAADDDYDLHRAPTIEAGIAEIEEALVMSEQPVESAQPAGDHDTPAQLETTEIGEDDGSSRRLRQLAPDPDHDIVEELTVPGGDEPPPLPDRPALSNDALAAMEAAVDSMMHEAESEPATARMEGAEFDESDLGHLEGVAADDRAHSTDAGQPRVTFLDVGTSEKTMPSRPSIRVPNLDMGETAQLMDEIFPHAEEIFPKVDDITNDGDEATRERPAQWPEGAPVIDEIDEEQTRDHSIFTAPSPIGQRAPTEDPVLREQAVIIDDSLLEDATSEMPAVRNDTDDELNALHGLIDEEVAGVSDEDATREVHVSGMEPDEFGRDSRSRTPISGVREDAPEVDAVRADVVAAQLNTEIELEAPAEETEDGRTRRRVAALIDRAMAEYEADRYPVAVSALDLALDERPDSAIAQKLVHSNREALFRIFEAYLGDDSAVPMVALPTHEIAVQELDSRAAFLLSRIDGMLTFDEILDVAGMGRMEAYRHLCRLLLRGILEVR